VARVYGVTVRTAFVDEALGRYRAFRDANAGAKSSLLVDIEHGRPTELELLHGTLVRLAAAKDVPVPVCATLCAVIRIGLTAPVAGPSQESAL
jgi:ketopantoate reductase